MFTKFWSEYLTGKVHIQYVLKHRLGDNIKIDAKDINFRVGI
jgi:hypothetical protein